MAENLGNYNHNRRSMQKSWHSGRRAYLLCAHGNKIGPLERLPHTGILGGSGRAGHDGEGGSFFRTQHNDYVVTINAYSGANLLGGFSVTNTNSSPVFAGVIDTSPAISQVVINSTHTINASSNCSYFGNLSLVGPPLLKVSAAGTNVTVFWPAPSTGFRLQENTNLATTNWSNFTGTTNDDGTNNKVLIQPATGSVFFRLITP